MFALKKFGFKYFGLLSFSLILAASSLSKAQQCHQYLSDRQTTSRSKNVVTALYGQNLLKVLTQEHEFTPLASAYLHLAAEGVLKSQTDPSLGRRGLLTENGGLCGPACVANITIAKERVQSIPAASYRLENYDKLVEEILATYTQSFLSTYGTYTDARNGTRLSLFFSRDSLMLKILDIKAEDLDPKSSEYNFRKLKNSNGVIFANVKFSNDLSSANHAILILGANTKEKKLYIADPNSPNDILITPYKTTPEGNLRFWLWRDLYTDATQAQMAQVELLEAFLLKL